MPFVIPRVRFAAARYGATPFASAATSNTGPASNNSEFSADQRPHERSKQCKKFHVNYRGKNLALDLVKVHDDRLSSLGGGKYFACVDMKAADGRIYDIDFFMAGQPGSMAVTETSVHKINGKPLYNWKAQGGVWKKVRVS